ncbi:PREDICTED: vacuolar protein sorting-associated protein 37B [Nicrophorus vespilloides]|uniref:Vacuolar protein sorting-associated protein 37B n=1 Tax=Nicrophorus vespilloides TaxID=110193 RepID=A0ABM1MIN3_NICVS|nr:PREDICTED: vacuolar protein sorting-associated protein 37B [Nicrophorus vespilloides]
MSMQGLHTDCKRIIASLSHLKNADLDEIMNDDEKIESLIGNLDQCYLMNLESEKERILTSINSLSDANLAREPELVEGREKVEELSAEGEELSKTVEEKYKDLRDKGGFMSTETALALLQTAASEMEEESDDLAKSFLDSDKDLDSFLDVFLVKRKVMHMRLVKAEKMAKLISQDGFYGQTNYINAPPMNINSNYFPGVPSVAPNAVPYPSGPINMPMPDMKFFQNY